MSRLLKVRVGRRQGGLPPAGELDPDQPWLHWTTIIDNAGNKTPEAELEVVAEGGSRTWRDEDKPAGVGDSWDNPWVVEDKHFVAGDGGLAARIYATYIVFRNCIFELHENTSNLHGIRCEGGSMVRFENCDMFCPQPVGKNVVMVYSNETTEVYRCNIWHGADGVRSDASNTLVDECYIHDLKKVGGSHNDMFQTYTPGSLTAPGPDRSGLVMRSNVLLFTYGQMQTAHMGHSLKSDKWGRFIGSTFEGNWACFGSHGAGFSGRNPDGSVRMVDGVVRRNAFGFTMSHPADPTSNYASRSGEPHWMGGTVANNMEDALFENNWLWVFDYPNADTIAKNFSSVPYDELYVKVTASQAGTGSWQPSPLPSPTYL